jgi:GST-like protein
MIDFYFHPSPNPMKVALFLEEAGLPYKVIPVDTRKGEQHAPAFRAINPNGKTPAIRHDDVALFDSNAILLHLAEKTGAFLGKPAERPQVLSWLMFVATGIGPYGGQAFHFKYIAKDQPYGLNRYIREIERHYEVLNDRLRGRSYIAAGDYTIVDIAAWGWIRLSDALLGEGWSARFPEVKRWFESIDARPAAARARAVGSDIAFKKDMDEEALRALFPQNYPEAA